LPLPPPFSPKVEKLATLMLPTPLRTERTEKYAYRQY